MGGGGGGGERKKGAAFPTPLTMIVAFSGNILPEEDLKKQKRDHYLVNQPIGHSELVVPSLFFKSEAKCEVIDMKIIFYSHVNKTHFQKEGFALRPSF